MPCRELSQTTTVTAPSGRVFAYADDIRNLARHMSERGSMPMMGSKLALEILTANTTGVGATYRYSGRMMGLVLDFSELVTKYVAGREKVWRTIGEPKLLIIRSYEMRVLMDPISPTASRLTIGIDYELPQSGFWRASGWLLADAYSRWCLASMVDGRKRDLKKASGAQ